MFAFSLQFHFFVHHFTVYIFAAIFTFKFQVFIRLFSCKQKKKLYNKNQQRMQREKKKSIKWNTHILLHSIDSRNFRIKQREKKPWGEMRKEREKRWHNTIDKWLNVTFKREHESKWKRVTFSHGWLFATATQSFLFFFHLVFFFCHLPMRVQTYRYFYRCNCVK